MAREPSTARRGFGRIERRGSGRYRARRTPVRTGGSIGRRRRSTPRRTPSPGSPTAGPRSRGRSGCPTTRQQYRMLLDVYIYPTFGDERLDRTTADDVTDWYVALAPGKETMRSQAYSLLRTVLGSAASARPKPLIPYNPRAHPRRRERQARPQGPARVAPGVGDDRRRAPGPEQADGAAGRLVRDAFRRARRTAARGHRSAEEPSLDHPRRRPPWWQVRRRLPEVRRRCPRRGDPAPLAPSGEGAPEEPRRQGQGRPALPSRRRQQRAHGAVDALKGLLPGQEGRRPRGPPMARSATRAASRPRPARPSPNSWAAWVTRPPVRRCDTSTPPPTEIARRLSALVEVSDPAGKVDS